MTASGTLRRTAGRAGQRPLLSRWRDPALVAAATVTTGLWALRWPSLSQDEISLVLYSDLVTQGRVTNLDFFTPYGPGAFWPLAGLFEVAGSPSLLWSRMLGLAYHVALALGVWALARRSGPRVALLAGTLSGLLAADLLLIPYGWLAALSATVWSVVLGRRRSWWLSGALAAVACTVRPEFFAVVVVVQAALLPDLRSLVRSAVGFLVGAIPLMSHLFVAGPELMRNVFLDRVLPNTRLPLSSATWSVRVGLLLLLAALLCLVLEAVRTRNRDEVSVAILSLLILPQALQRTDREHILFVGVLVLPLAMAVAVRFLGGATPRARAGPVLQDRLAVGAASSVVLLGAVLSSVAPSGDVLEVGGRSIITTGPRASAQIESVVRAIDQEVDRGEVMLIGTEDMSRAAVTPTYLYFLMPNRIPQAYYLELAPGVSEREGSLLLDDVRSADVLVLSEFSGDQRDGLFPQIDDGSTEVNDYVSTHFCAVQDVAFVSIYRRCAG